MGDALSQMLTWPLDKQIIAVAALIFAVVVSLCGAGWKLYTYYSKPRSSPMVDMGVLVEQLVSHQREVSGLERLDRHQQNEVIKALTAAVTALVKQKDQPDAPAGIDDALAHLAQGKTADAEAIFQEILEISAQSLRIRCRRCSEATASCQKTTHSSADLLTPRNLQATFSHPLQYVSQPG
ncbi:MAG: hypothetical protein IID45_11705 [Planctomycetes bacterium]|nr:hypothetical protein [Planctomycetota bacterium]